MPVASALFHVGQLAILLASGWCLGRRLVPSVPLVERAVVSVGLSLTAIPTLAVGAAWALDVRLAAPLVLAVAAATAVASRPWSLARDPRPDLGELASLAALVAAAVVLVGLTEFQATVAPYLFRSCLHRAALFLHEFASPDPGWTLWAPDLGRHFTYLLPPATGPVMGFYEMIDQQRLANASIVGCVMSIAGRAGIELLAGLVFFVVAGSASLLASPLVPRRAVRVAIGVTTLAALHGLAAYMVNGSTFALAAGMLSLWFLLREPATVGGGIAAGFFAGFGVGSRLAALAWIPALTALSWSQPRRVRIALWAAFAASVAPWLAASWVLRGNPFFHPVGPDSLATNEFLGIEFRSWPLDWPFTDALVRAPGQILPPILLVPILVIRSMGGVVLAAAMIGLARLLRQRTGWGLLLWALPVSALACLAYIDDEKASWILIGMPVVPVALASFASFARSRGPWRTAAWLAPLAAALALAPAWLAGVESGVDSRDYRVVGPNFPAGSIHVRYGDAWHEALARAAVLPRLQDVAVPPATLASLTPSVQEERFSSGALAVVLQDWDGPFDVETPVVPDFDRAPLPEPGRLLHPANAPGTNGMTAVVLGLPVSSDARLRVAGSFDGDTGRGGGNVRVEIDPGSPPHRLGFVSFLLDREGTVERPMAVPLVSVAGRTVATRAAGRAWESPSGARVFNPVLVTNLPLPPQPGSAGDADIGGEKWHWSWTVAGPGGLPDAADAGLPVLPFVGPTGY